MFQHLAHLSPTSSSLSSYAFFKWQIKRHVNEAGDLFKRACDFDRDRIYFYVFFIARQFHDKRSASMILQASALKLYIDGNPDGDPEAERTEYADSIFSLALAYHQIPMAEEAEKLYRQHLTICTKHNIYTLSNLAELLLHSIGNFEEAKQLYQKALEKAGDHNETIEFALVGLQLASGDREGGLIKLNKLIDSSYIKASKNALTECAIVNYIHCYPDSKKSALKLVKELLVTEQVRPKLILMFDANLKWARAQNLPDYNLMEKICAVYNCEYFVEVLDEFSEWRQIEVPAPPPDLGLAPAH